LAEGKKEKEEMAVWDKILYELKNRGRIDKPRFEALSAKGASEGIKELVADKTIEDEAAACKFYFSSLKARSLEDVLIADGLLSAAGLEKLIDEFGGVPGNLKDILIERNIIYPAAVYKAIAVQHQADYIDLNAEKIDDALFSKFDINIIRRYQFIPHKMEGDKLVIIIDDPSDVERIEEIESVIGIPTRADVAVKSDISRVINLMIETSLSETTLFSDSDDTPLLKTVNEEADDAAADAEFLKTLSDVSIVKTVDSIILKAIRKKASDIHFEVYPEGLKVKYRIDGALYVVKTIDVKSKNFIISRLKNMANLDISEKRIPQDGRFKRYIDERAIDFRMSVLPSVFGETVVIRVLDQNALGLDINRLGFPETDLVRFKKNIFKPYGMILVAGPTGSGKTTTLYSAIRAIKTPEDKFITIEDPVEYQIPDIVQINVNEKKGLTFASGLRSIVRQDPDEIMVGEIRDFETANIAINAALTGHLVLSTIHANNVIDAIGRLVNMGVDPYQFAASFNIIMSQRLIRKICSNCRQECAPDGELVKLMGDFEIYKDNKFYKGAGCRFCHNTGYSGRTGIYETMPLSDMLKSMVIGRISPLEIKKQAVAEGMTTLRQSAWRLVVEGVSTIEEINRMTFED
jgi:type IV pilus assembly protein PilB